MARTPRWLLAALGAAACSVALGAVPHALVALAHAGTASPAPYRNIYANGLTRGPDGALWIAETAGDAVARVTPRGRVTTFPVPSGKEGAYGSSPYFIAAGHDGAL